MKGGAKVHELLQSLKKKNVHVPATLDKQVTEIVDTTGKMRMPESRAKQEKMLRQVNYGNVQMSMDRWLPVVKLNREKDQLNFTEKVNNNVRVNFFPSNSKTPLTERIES
jgi:U3 small nucleolar RNA-associated protein 14